jgi:type II secretory pathway component GspD/PulD (secretin)
VDVDETDLRELYMYRLRHARAPALAATLQALFGGAIPTGSTANRAQTLSQQLNQLQAGGATQAVAPQSIILQQPGSGELEGNVLIIPDEVTNSLLVRATPGDWTIVESAMRGRVGVEFEGRALDEVEGIRLTKALLERVRDEFKDQYAA